MLDRQFHISRREKFLEFLKDGQAGIFFAGSTKMMAGTKNIPSVSTGTSFILQAVKSRIPFIWHTGKRGREKKSFLSAGLIPVWNAMRPPAGESGSRAEIRDC